MKYQDFRGLMFLDLHKARKSDSQDAKNLDTKSGVNSDSVKNIVEKLHQRRETEQDPTIFRPSRLFPIIEVKEEAAKRDEDWMVSQKNCRMCDYVYWLSFRVPTNE